MLTYDITNVKGPIYKELYRLIKNDIIAGRLKSNERMPSKRTLAKNLGISTISIENSYDQLICEGYLYAIPKRGYFVAQLNNINRPQVVLSTLPQIKIPKENPEYYFDFSSNNINPKSFPFSVWAKVIRETISNKEYELLRNSPCSGVKDLREAIAGHLQSFRGMTVSADQIIIGAGTEYLYGLLIKLLGKDQIYCIENPGYNKLSKIYESNDVKYSYCYMDSKGIVIKELEESNANIAHVSPTHHFPTGITMPVTRRYELLAWANNSENRYIIEDDYDSEFRINGKPIPPLQSLDVSGKVIYMNTFSKSLASTIRISYMVLPEQLANKFYKELSFYSCTVSTFEQYALAAFIKEGYFEKHINRMRLQYGRKRTQVIQLIQKYFSTNESQIIENDSGLHFILEINTRKSETEIKNKLLEYNIKINSISDFDMNNLKLDKHQFIINYSNIEMDKLNVALMRFREILNNPL